MEQYFLDSEKTKKSGIKMSVRVAVTQDEGAIALYHKLEKQILMNAESRLPGTHCHMLKELWDVHRITIY